MRNLANGPKVLLERFYPRVLFHEGVRGVTAFAPAAVILSGAVIRIGLFLQNRAFRLDEAWMAFDLNQRTLIQVLTNSHYQKPVPVGFALISKLLLMVFGNHEYTFRLFPLLAGVFSLIFFWEVCARWLGPKVGLLATTLLAFLSPHVYYSADFKYYSIDVFFTLLLYSQFLRYQRSARSKLDAAGLIFVGVTALACSYATLFVLAGLAFVLLKDAWFCQRGKKNYAAVILGAWGLTFLAFYFFFFRGIDSFSGLKAYWQKGFWPWPVYSGSSVAWFWSTTLQNFQTLFAAPYPMLVTVVSVWGMIRLWKIKSWDSFIIFLPLGLVLLAAMLHKYPYYGRVILFLVPGLLLVMCVGLEKLLAGHRPARIAGWLCFVVLLLPQAQLFRQGPGAVERQEDVRPLIRYLSVHRQPGDVLYLNNSAQHLYWYYWVCYYRYPYPLSVNGIVSDNVYSEGERPFVYLYYPVDGFDSKAFLDGEIFPGRIHPQKHDHSVLKGKARVWFLYAHGKEEAEKHFVKFMETRGEGTAIMQAEGASLSRFYLSGKI